MPRPRRLVIPGGHHHVTIRGNDRQAIFLDGDDYQAYLTELGRCCREWSCQVVAYAFMPNHVHLLIRDGEGQLSRLMQVLNARYTRYFNRQHLRVGHLYQGRFHARLVEQNNYLLEVTRYIHLNPVRADLVSRPEAYRWSSYRCYAGFEGEGTRLVDPQLIWSLMSADQARQPLLYRQFVESMTPERMGPWETRLCRLKLIPPFEKEKEKEKCQTLLPA